MSSGEEEPIKEARGWRLNVPVWLKQPREWFVDLVYIVALLTGATVIVVPLGMGLVAFFNLGQETLFETDQAKRLEAAKLFFTVLVALIGGPLLIWRVISAHWSATAARHQAETDREGLYTGLFTKAVEQLGATREAKTYQEVDDGAGGKKREAVTTTEPNLEVRLGAIYALDRVARDSERDHWPIMQVLCSYVRNPQNSGPALLRPESAASRSSKKYYAWLTAIKPPRVDVQAALTVIGERLERSRKLEADRNLRLDLRNANLQRAVLNGGYFERAIFVEAHLDGASFDEAHLADAWFYEAHLEGGSFDRAHLDGAVFGGAHLVGASFDGAHLDGTRFFKTDLSQVESLDPVALAHALGDASTKLPDGMERPAAWPDRVLSSDERQAWIEKSRATPPDEP